jgi:hypothetical protein
MFITRYGWGCYCSLLVAKICFDALLRHAQATQALPLTLALLMARIGADNIDHAAAADDLAVLANSLDAGSDFHDSTLDIYEFGRSSKKYSA